MLGIVALVYAGSSPDRQLRGAAALQNLQQIAPNLTLAAMLIQAVALTLLGPILTSGSITDERRKRSLETLLTTPIRPWQIIVGKLFGSLSTLLILAVLPLPLLLAVRIFGGVSEGSILCLAVISISTGLLGSALGLRASMLTSKPSNASVLALAVLAAVISAPALLALTYMIVMGGTRLATGGTIWTFASLSPIVSTIGNAEELMSGTSVVFSNPTESAFLSVGYNLAWTAVIVLWNSVTLRTLMRKEAAGLLKPVVAKAKRRRTAAKAEQEESSLPTRKPRRVENGESREVGDDPVLWRELRQPLFARPLNLIVMSAVLVLAMLGMLCLTLIQGGPRVQDLALFIVPITVFFFIMQAGTLSAGCITTEREARTWEVLLTAPIHPFRILLGKTLGSLRRLWFLPVVILVLLLVFGVAEGRLNPVVLVMVALSIAGPAFFLCCTGTMFSLLLKKSSTAGVANVGLAFAMWAVLPLMLGLFAEIGRDPELTRIVQSFIALSNPLVHAGNAIGTLVDHSHSSASPVTYQLPPDLRFGMIEYTLVLAVFSASYIALGALALGWAARLFKHAAPRPS